MGLGNSQKSLTTNKLLVSTIILNKYKYFFLQSAFWLLFNYSQKRKLNRKQCSLCCSLLCFYILLCTHYEPSTYFGKLKEIEVLRPISSDYVISYDLSLSFIIVWYVWQILGRSDFFPRLPSVSSPEKTHPK